MKTPVVVFLVLDNPALLHDVLQAWEAVGVPGATVLESTGMRRVADSFGRDDLPLLPSLREITQSEQAAHRTIFSVLPDDSLVDALIEATERIAGDLSQPHTGVLFVTPALRVVGGGRSSP
jgi:hypothetical protein